jgi:hypothetical protein
MSVFVCLGENKLHFSEDAFGDGFYFFVSCETFFAYSAIDYNNGDIQLVCDLNEVGPNLQFHQQANCRLDLPKGTAHYPGKIKGKVEHLQSVAEKISCTGKAGVGCGAYYYFKIAEFIFKFFNNSFCGIDFANAYGVKPYTFSGRVFAGDFAEAVSPAGTVAIVSGHPIHDYGAVSYGSQQIYKID